MTSESNLLHFL